ncbi:glycerol-3-phosphate acyltransferase [Striga asiatica]|uniref:Glycerol-3-phosphate acyltransferase n=1 Tax=Striga asiatica TaxID=4170 RepID=A0A5A7RC56_STRAF|nr:glycerol-3-phosphate acyltransferase [Striga asiatica]
MLKSSLKILQSLSVISSSFLSDQCRSTLMSKEFISREVSSVFSQSNENRNFSLGLITLFFGFLDPRYCSFIAVSSISRSLSANFSRRARSRALCSSSRSLSRFRRSESRSRALRSVSCDGGGLLLEKHLGAAFLLSSGFFLAPLEGEILALLFGEEDRLL